MMRWRKNRCFIIFSGCLLILVLYVSGILHNFCEKCYECDFEYPLNLNLTKLVDQVIEGIKPDVEPINYYPFDFIMTCPEKCTGPKNTDLLILVKSAVRNFDRRSAIRKTWGLETRFPDTEIRTVFFLGLDDADDNKVLEDIYQEQRKYNDIVQMNFIDAYFNNTIKTMMAFRWANEYCSTSEHYFFADDDMYISIVNLLKYLNNPSSYPLNVHVPEKTVDSVYNDEIFNRHLINNTPLSKNKHLYSGFRFTSAPIRSVTSKWFVSLEEYPWNRWPPYVTAGAYVMSNSAVKVMYAGSLFVKHFRFDDVYLGIVSKKVGLTPLHCNEFYFYKKTYSIDNYKYVIASHGYHNTEELIKVWSKQRRLGSA